MVSNVKNLLVPAKIFETKVMQLCVQDLPNTFDIDAGDNRHIKTNTFEDFVKYLEGMCGEHDRKFNRHVFEHKRKATKLKEMWEVWRKIFGPQYVRMYLLQIY